MQRPTLDGRFVVDVEINDRVRLLVDDDVALSTFDGHDSREVFFFSPFISSDLVVNIYVCQRSQ